MMMMMLVLVDIIFGHFFNALLGFLGKGGQLVLGGTMVVIGGGLGRLLLMNRGLILRRAVRHGNGILGRWVLFGPGLQFFMSRANFWHGSTSLLDMWLLFMLVLLLLLLRRRCCCCGGMLGLLWHAWHGNGILAGGMFISPGLQFFVRRSAVARGKMIASPKGLSIS